MTESEQATLEQALMQFGVSAEKAPEMAAQLDKRAQQLAEALSEANDATHTDSAAPSAKEQRVAKGRDSSHGAHADR